VALRYTVGLWSSRNDFSEPLDRSKDVSVYVSTCISYDFNALTSVASDKTRIFVRLVAEMSGRFLERQMNIKFCVKLGQNANNTLRGYEAMKKSRVSK
jgi:hypothetical protein